MAKVLSTPEVEIVQLTGDFTGWRRGPLPTIMSPEMMLQLLGGSFPDTGFSWDMVAEFRLENGVWEPYSGIGEILPACGFRITANPEEFPYGE